MNGAGSVAGGRKRCRARRILARAELRQRYVIVPAKGGFVVLVIKGTSEAFEKGGAGVKALLGSAAREVKLR